jgi:S1-C subfamily serine protease
MRSGPGLVFVLWVVHTAPCYAQGEPAYCAGDYADDLQTLTPRVHELERQAYSFCVRNTAVYECLSYSLDGNVRRTRRMVSLHGTAFAYRQLSGETLLLTNEHVAEWPQVTDDGHLVEGVPSGCKRMSETLRLVDNEEDRYETDDVALQRVAVDPQRDAAVLKAKVLLPVLPWKIGRSAALRERNVVEVRGFPLGAFAATNVGKVVSAYDHDDEREWDHDDFVVDALLSSGNSGSPVLAVSCRTGEFELVGLYHAGYTQGSALNVVVGIDQLRDLMTTLKTSPRAHGQVAVVLDRTAREDLARQLGPAAEPFFPFGSLTAAVRARADGGLVFEVFPREFPFRATPVFVYEDLPSASSFGDPQRLWFGGSAGLKRYRRSDLDADAQAQVIRLIEALRRDAVAFFAFRALSAPGTASREQFNQLSRLEQTLSRTVNARRDLSATLPDLIERLGPRGADVASPVADIFQPETPQPITLGASSAQAAQAH